MVDRSATPDVAAIAGLLGEATRSRMLTALMQGRALTATELALEGGVTPSTASTHLARLRRAGLVEIARQGRHRYFRLAGGGVAAAIEGLMRISPPAAGGRRSHSGPNDHGLRRARVCYDHLAGEAGVGLLAGLRSRRLIVGGDEAMALSREGVAWCARIGIDLGALRVLRRPLLRPCLDWSERRSHLAGAVGAALLERLLTLRLARRELDSRALRLTPRGESFLERLELPR
ncbi:MAG TPA: helix-turn-helix transcriptional regulator [Kofleriaceae bacterium]